MGSFMKKLRVIYNIIRKFYRVLGFKIGWLAVSGYVFFCMLGVGVIISKISIMWVAGVLRILFALCWFVICCFYAISWVKEKGLLVDLSLKSYLFFHTTPTVAVIASVFLFQVIIAGGSFLINYFLITFVTIWGVVSIAWFMHFLVVGANVKAIKGVYELVNPSLITIQLLFSKWNNSFTYCLAILLISQVVIRQLIRLRELELEEVLTS